MGKYSKFRNIVVLGIVLFLSLVLSVGLANAGGDGYISFKLDGKVYKFSDGPLAFFVPDDETPHTILGALDISADKFILISFEGNSRGTYFINPSDLFNQIHYYEGKDGWIAIGSFGEGKIKVTRYGHIGGYITGKFSGKLTGELTGSQGVKQISGSFKIKRISDLDESFKSALDNDEITNKFHFLKHIIEEAAKSAKGMD